MTARRMKDRKECGQQRSGGRGRGLTPSPAADVEDCLGGLPPELSLISCPRRLPITCEKTMKAVGIAFTDTGDRHSNRACFARSGGPSATQPHQHGPDRFL